ncbi:MAG: hypothetical protein J2P31_20785 [Blastocatellia bacterium]|nr:hypothetical protein [Blastocatellia bacterium]
MLARRALARPTSSGATAGISLLPLPGYAPEIGPGRGIDGQSKQNYQ